jgi:serine/threonine-protein kinase
MVHRDIKPENILMAWEDDGWIPKIADFGIVATRESSVTLTKTGRGSALTMPYAAPEQWRGMRSTELDGRTDFYALGGVLFEMLTGQTVFHADSYEGWAEQHRSAAPRPPSNLRPDLAKWKGLDDLVLCLLAKNRGQRPADAEQLLQYIEEIQSGSGLSTPLRAAPDISAQPAYPGPPAAQPIYVLPSPSASSSNSGLFIMLAIALCAALIGVAAIWHSIALKPQNTQSSSTQSNSNSSPSGTTFTQASSTSPSSPPGTSGSTAFPSSDTSTPSPVPQPQQDPIERYKSECDQGVAKSCSILGLDAYIGSGLPLDHVKSLEYYIKACSAKDGDSCGQAGSLYYLDSYVPQNTSLAMTYLRRGCELGSTFSCGQMQNLQNLINLHNQMMINSITGY